MLKNKKTIWKKSLANLITDYNELIKLLELEHVPFKGKLISKKKFPLRVPRHFINNMQKGTWSDPLLQQILVLSDENKDISGYSDDPLEEKKHNPTSGILHKYKGRALVMLTKACAIHCRYCFRKNFDYTTNIPSRSEWKNILSYLENDQNIREVILSGGDPLTLSDEILISFCSSLEKIKHIQRLRIHTRIPVVFPERMTSNFIKWIAHYPLQLIIVIHANHPNEISDSVQKKLLILRKNKIVLLNQSVLLRNINDDVNTLALLSEKLFNVGVLPYYLHVLDKVKGTAHFSVSNKKIKQLYTELNNQLPGYLVPKLVREESGKGSKTLL